MLIKERNFLPTRTVSIAIISACRRGYYRGTFFVVADRCRTLLGSLLTPRSRRRYYCLACFIKVSTADASFGHTDMRSNARAMRKYRVYLTL